MANLYDAVARSVDGKRPSSEKSGVTKSAAEVKRPSTNVLGNFIFEEVRVENMKPISSKLEKNRTPKKVLRKK